MRLLAAIVFLYTLLPVYAENFYTGDKLLGHCEDCVYSVNISSVSACAYCISHMSSIHDAFVDWSFMEPKWCIAGDISLSELTKQQWPTFMKIQVADINTLLIQLQIHL